MDPRARKQENIE